MDGIIATLARAAGYAASHSEELAQAFADHLWLAGVALSIGILSCVPLGILTSRYRWAAATFMRVVNGLRAVPSLAILFLVIPYLGLSKTSAALALTLLALPPILINTDTAFRTIHPAIRESAFGMGMTSTQVLVRIEWPLALPVILAGIRTAAVEVIASATLAAFVGSGGLGIYITRGFAMYDESILLVGAVPVALLSLAVELGLSALQRAVRPPGLTLAQQ